MTERYQWRKKEGAEIWTLDLFKSKKGKLPFLTIPKKVNTAPHQLEIFIFSPKDYKRPYREERVSENSGTVTYKKVFLNSYTGKIDTELSLTYIGGMDYEGRHFADFLSGEFKVGYLLNGKFSKDVEEFRKSLTDYFEGVKPEFGENLKNLIVNSNLPEKPRNSLRNLWR